MLVPKLAGQFFAQIGESIETVIKSDRVIQKHGKIVDLLRKFSCQPQAPASDFIIKSSSLLQAPLVSIGRFDEKFHREGG
jgi:hypothetical protein